MRTIYQNTCLLSLPAALLPPACSTNGPVQLSAWILYFISVQCLIHLYLNITVQSNNAICLRHSAVASSALDNREQFQ